MIKNDVRSRKRVWIFPCFLVVGCACAIPSQAEPPKPFDSHFDDSGWCKGIAVSSDSRYFVGFLRGESKRQQAKLFDLFTGKEVQRFVAPRDGDFSSIDISPNGRLLATGQVSSHTVRLWDTETGEIIRTIKNAGSQVKFSHNGKILAALRDGIGITCFDVAQGMQISSAKFDADYKITPQFLLGDRYIVAAEWTVLRVFDVATGRQVKAIDLNQRPGFRSEYSFHGLRGVATCTNASDARLVATAHYNFVTIWDIVKGVEIRRLGGENNRFGSTVSFTPDGLHILSENEDHDSYKIIRIRDGKLMNTYDLGKETREIPARITPDGRFMLSCHTSCGVVVWDVATAKPLMRFVCCLQDRSWIVESASSVFDASPAALEHLRKRSGSYAQKYWFSGLASEKSAYDPSTMSQIVGSLRPTPTSNAAETSIEINSERETASDLVVKISIIPSGAANDISRVSVWANGRPVLFPRRVSGPQPIPDAPVFVSEKYDPSKHARSELDSNAFVFESVVAKHDSKPIRLRVLTVDDRDCIAEKTKTIQLNEVPSRSTSARAEVSQPRLFVLAVGVSNYKYREYNLRFCERDAWDLAKLLRQQKGRAYSDVQEQVYLDQAATTRNVLNGLNWLQRSCTTDDVAVVLFSGHGIRGRRGLYFVTHEGDMNNISSTCLNWADVATRVVGTRAKQILFLSDCCHAGAFAGERLATQSELAQDFLNKPNLTLIASSQGNQPSLEHESSKNGAFTQAVLESLDGSADGFKAVRIRRKNRSQSPSTDGKISVAELVEYVSDRVSQMTNGSQTPEILVGDSSSQFILSQSNR